MSVLPRELNMLLADDDRDDCFLFKEGLKGLQLQTALTIVHDGEQLMQLLTKNSNEGALLLVSENKSLQPAKEKFVLGSLKENLL